MKTKVFFLCILFLANLAKADLNSYDNLPCATEKQFESLAKEIQLSTWPDGKLCDDSLKAKLGKILVLMSKLGVTPASDYKGGAITALKNPIGYVGMMANSISLDFTKKDFLRNIIAFNQGGNIHLGALFFKLSPLEAVGTLIHESRHSDQNDPKHARCRYGDIPQNAGGCDEWLRLDQYSGAYAYEVAYNYGLTKFSSLLSVSDKKFITANALAMIGTRFNFVPNFLATPHEVIVALDNKGKCYLVHPFLSKERLIPLNCQTPKGSVIRIESNAAKSYINLYTDFNQVYSLNLSQSQPWLALNESLVPENTPIIDIANLNIGEINKSSINYNYFLTKENKLFYFWLNQETGNWAVAPSSYQPKDIRARYLVHGGIDRRYLVDDRGTVYFFGDGSSFELSRFNTSGGWIHVSSGVIFDTVFGIDQGGQLYYKNYEKQDPDIFPSAFKIPAKSKKYIDGAGLRLQLDTEGNLYIKRRGESEFLKIPSSSIIDIALIRNWDSKINFEIKEGPLEEFIKACDVRSAWIDPWMQKGIGISAKGQIVFEGETPSKCLLFESPGEDFSEIKISSSELEEETDKFSQTSLVLKRQNGSKQQVWPYK